MPGRSSPTKSSLALARPGDPRRGPDSQRRCLARAGSVDDLRLPIRPDALARIVLTSGSTGEPKAIMQTHRTTLFGAITRNNAVHTCAATTGCWLERRHSPSCARPLFIGATLYLFDFKGDDIKCLRGWIDDAQISTFRSTPSVFRQLVATLALRRGGARADENLFPSLRVIELMGEPVSSGVCRAVPRGTSRGPAS